MDLQTRRTQNKGIVFEFGEGTGLLAEIFRTRFRIEPDCVELDPYFVSLITSKRFKCFQFFERYITKLCCYLYFQCA